MTTDDTYRTSALVTHERYVEFVQDGAIIAIVPATFDLSSLSPDLRPVALATLQSGIRVGLPSRRPRASLPEPTRPWWRFW
jgi:hypothetical protein